MYELGIQTKTKLLWIWCQSEILTENPWNEFSFPQHHFMCFEYDFSGTSGMVAQTHSLNFATDWQSDRGEKLRGEGN